MNHQPKPIVMSGRASVYAPAHILPDIVKRTVDLPPLDIRHRIIQDILTEVIPFETSYISALGAQAEFESKNGCQSFSLKQHVQSTRQRLNGVISLRRHSLAQVLGLNNSEFTRLYLPKHLDGLWFGGLKKESTPVEFLRAQLQKIFAERAALRTIA